MTLKTSWKQKLNIFCTRFKAHSLECKTVTFVEIFWGVFCRGECFSMLLLLLGIFERCYKTNQCGTPEMSLSTWGVLQALNRHSYAYADRECDNKYVTTPGYLQWRDGGEKHMNDPMTISNLQVHQLVLFDILKDWCLFFMLNV